MGNQLTFSGSGELDNGLNVSISFVLDQGDDAGSDTNADDNAGAPFDSHSVSVSSDGPGTLNLQVKVELTFKLHKILLLLVTYGILVSVFQLETILKRLHLEIT